MTMKTVKVDYGAQKLDIEVPSHAVIAEFEDPEFLPDPTEAVRQALAKPYDSPPLRELAKPGMKVAIGFDDITRPPTSPQTILPVVVEELLACGIKERDIVFINACSNHRKNTRSELAAHLGLPIFNRFWPVGQIKNHDCTDDNNLRYFGYTDGGRLVEMNKEFVDADLMIYQGNVSSTTWKTYTGTGVVVGLGSTRSIASHHSFHSIPDPNRKRGQDQKAAPGVKEEMTSYLEAALGRSVFYINAVNGSGGRMAGVFAGSAKGVIKPSWAITEKMCPKTVPQADVLIIGLPRAYSYGASNNTLIAAVGACVPPRYSSNLPILREGGVVIGITPSNGMIDPDMYPSYQEVIDLYGRYFSVRQLVDHEDELNNRPLYRHKYTHGYGYPPLHPFWLMYENEYALKRASSVILAGVSNPGPFRPLGIRPEKDFADAWKTATQNVGKNPVTVVAPTFFSKPRIKFHVE